MHMQEGLEGYFWETPLKEPLYKVQLPEDLLYFTLWTEAAEFKIFKISEELPPLIQIWLGANFSIFGVVEKVCPFEKSTPRFTVAQTLKLHLK